MQATHSDLPTPVSRALKKFGDDIRVARLKRGLTIEMMSERTKVHRETYRKVEHGHPGVGLGVYAAALYALGFGTIFDALIDQSRDETGLLLDKERIPKRIRPKKEPQGL
jgi:transcriptional regulator with XRE-family HTH domain